MLLRMSHSEKKFHFQKNYLKQIEVHTNYTNSNIKGLEERIQLLCEI